MRGQTIHSPGRGRESGMTIDREILKKVEAITVSLKAHRKELLGLLARPMSKESLNVVERLEDSIDHAVSDGFAGTRALRRKVGQLERGSEER